jgi:hypothetical protein
MFKRFFMLRLAAIFITFLIGWTAANLFGTPRPFRLFAHRTHARVVFVPFNAGPDFDAEHAPPCGSYRMQHAFRWRDRRDAGFDFDSDAPPAPPAPSQPSTPRGSN